MYEPDSVLTRIQSYLETSPKRVRYGQPALARWLVEQLRTQQAAAFVDRGDVILVSNEYQESLHAIEAQLPPLAPRSRLIGQHEGIWYALAPRGDVWQWTGSDWHFVCRAGEWIGSAIAHALIQKESEHE
jgi:hypothetical protein